MKKHTLMLSRYFYDNVIFVASMCPKCYEDSEEVQIIGINIGFLQQYQRNLFNKFFEEAFVGFTRQEIEYTVNNYEKFNEKTNKYRDFLEKLEMTFEESSENRAIICQTAVKKNVSKVGYKVNKKIYLHKLKNISKEKKMKWKRYYKNLMGKNEEHSQYFTEFDADLHNFKNINLSCDNIKIETDVPLTVQNCNNNNKDKQETEDVAAGLKVKRKEFISDFLFANFEFMYFENRKDADVSNLVQSSWNPPRSPHNLIEECLYKDPWALLVSTIFLNRTSCLLARPYVFWFLSENPDPLTVLDKFPSDLEKYFTNLGLSKTRAVQVYRMSYDFVLKPWKNVKQLYGIGEYGECAYRMFCLGDFSVEPTDRFLKIYKAWHERLQGKQYCL